MTIAVLSLLVAASAVLHLRAEYGGSQRAIYLFKPLTTILILGVAVAGAPSDPGYYGLAIAVALVFSLAGDVFLMLPGDRFLPGLASFFVAHLIYIGAFASLLPSGPSVVTALPFAALAIGMLRLLGSHLGSMRVPATAYIAVISLMAWLAVDVWWTAAFAGGGFVATGAVLFAISDSALAINRFRQPFHASQWVVLSTYFSAQWLLALSVGGGAALAAWLG